MIFMTGRSSSDPPWWTILLAGLCWAASPRHARALGFPRSAPGHCAARHASLSAIAQLCRSTPQGIRCRRLPDSNTVRELWLQRKWTRPPCSAPFLLHSHRVRIRIRITLYAVRRSRRLLLGSWHTIKRQWTGLLLVLSRLHDWMQGLRQPHAAHPRQGHVRRPHGAIAQ